MLVKRYQTLRNFGRSQKIKHFSQLKDQWSLKNYRRKLIKHWLCKHLNQRTDQTARN